MKRYNRWFCLLSLLCVHFLGVYTVKAQSDPLSTQYYLNPVVLNPGFTGFRNSLAMDLSVRRQWMGIKGAPSSVFFAMHSPLNDSKVSLGGYLQQSQAGPLVYNTLNLDYSFLLRLSDKSFISLGMDFGLMNERLSFKDIVVIDQGDPNFGKEDYSNLIPTIGVGAVFFTPNFYAGISRPTIAIGNVALGEKNVATPEYRGSYYGTAGITLPAVMNIATKISAIGRFLPKGGFLMDNTVQLIYNNLVGLGISYRPKVSTSVMMRIQATTSLGFIYSYDMPSSSSTYITKGSHEITICYDYDGFYKKNRFRAFRSVKEEKIILNTRSLRQF